MGASCLFVLCLLFMSLLIFSIYQEKTQKEENSPPKEQENLDVLEEQPEEDVPQRKEDALQPEESVS